MAQPAQRESRKTPISIEAIWERPTAEPLVRCEKWRIQIKLAILAQETLHGTHAYQPCTPPPNMNFPPEPTDEES